MPDIATISNHSALQEHRRSIESPFRDNADLILPCSVDPQASNRDDQIRQIAIQICPFLVDRELKLNHALCSVAVDDKPSESSLSVKPLLGGLSNELFVVANTVLVRIHPDDAVSMVDREKESHFVAWLSRQYMAPIFYGRFQNGRVEELYPHVEPLTYKEMVPYGPFIAQAMADFHSLAPPTRVLPKPDIPSRFETVDHWVKTILSSTSATTEMAQFIAREWTWLKRELLSETPGSKAVEFIREVVLTHMDCQSLNILKDTSSDHPGRIRLIDFEYAGWNQRAADIANTFCEHCEMNNICADFEQEFPCETVQNNFLKAYLERCRPDLLQEGVGVFDSLRQEIGRFTLLSHLGWAAWSVVKETEGAVIEFDYHAYAEHRLDGYKLGKSRFFTAACC